MVAVLGVVAVAEDGDRPPERRPDVVEVDPGGHHPHDHLEGAGLGHLDLLEPEGVRRLPLALGANHPCGHPPRQLAGLDADARRLRYLNRQRDRLPFAPRRTGIDGRRAARC